MRHPFRSGPPISLSTDPEPHGLPADAMPGVSVLDGGVIVWREDVTVTVPDIDRRFSRLSVLIDDRPEFGWIWDVSELNPPVPAVLLHFQRRAAELAPRTRHLAVCTGANVGLWLVLRHVLPKAGFGAITVHRHLDTAYGRAHDG